MPASRKKIAISAEDMLISQRDAQRLVGDREIAAAFEGLQAGYLEAFANTKPDEAGKRELAYQHYNAVTRVWGALVKKAQNVHVRDLKDAAAKGDANG